MMQKRLGEAPGPCRAEGHPTGHKSPLLYQHLEAAQKDLTRMHEAQEREIKSTVKQPSPRSQGIVPT